MAGQENRPKPRQGNQVSSYYHWIYQGKIHIIRSVEDLDSSEEPVRPTEKGYVRLHGSLGYLKSIYFLREIRDLKKYGARFFPLGDREDYDA